MRREEPSGDPVLGNSLTAHSEFVNKIRAQWCTMRNYTCRETNTLRHSQNEKKNQLTIHQMCIMLPASQMIFFLNMQ